MADLLHRFGCALQLVLTIIIGAVLVRSGSCPLWAACLVAVPAGMLSTWAMIMVAGVVLDR